MTADFAGLVGGGGGGVGGAGCGAFGHDCGCNRLVEGGVEKLSWCREHGVGGA